MQMEYKLILNQRFRYSCLHEFESGDHSGMSIFHAKSMHMDDFILSVLLFNELHESVHVAHI